MGFATLLIVAAVAVTTHAVLPAGWCTQAGDVICSADCSAIEICIPAAEAGFFDHQVVEACSNTTSCYLPEKKCSEEFSTCPVTIPFECTSNGAYPDPYDCRVSQICLDTGVIENKCPNGYAYDSNLKSCSVPLSSYPRICTVSPVPVCTGIGQSGALCENPSIYYTCIRNFGNLHPILYQCMNGKVFDEVLFDCVDPVLRDSNVVNGCQYPEVGPTH